MLHGLYRKPPVPSKIPCFFPSAVLYCRLRTKHQQVASAAFEYGALAQLVERAFGLLLPLGPQNSSFEDSLQTRRRKTRETPPENLLDPIRGISTVGRTNHPYLRPTGNQFRKPAIGADGKYGRNCYQIRGISTDGSARHSHCRGQGFDSPMLHKKTLQIKVCKVFSCSFFSRSEYADTAQLPLVYYSRVFFCRVRSLPSVSAGPYTPGEYSANSND